jgi:2-(1,2-epoxy-1,2-dihydrophenyl)acetyl-CoA isomerase
LDFETVRAESKNGVLWIGLKRPDRLNAFDEQMGSDLLEALKEGERSPEARCAVVTGEGRAFSVGEDLDSKRAAYEGGKLMPLGEALMRMYNPVVQRIKKMNKPVIAGVNGVTAGLGLGLALACDLRAASSKATFSEAYIKAGRAPYSGTSFWLTRILGRAKAMEAGFLREPIDSTMAMNLGLVDWVFPDDRFVDEVARLAERLAKGHARSLGLTKRVLNRAIVVDTGSVLEYEMYLQELERRTTDRVEDVKASEEGDRRSSSQRGKGQRTPRG